jgi:hypothetical protein
VNVLDENMPEGQRLLLGRWKIAARQIGVEVGSKGMTDGEIIPLLQTCHRPTFFTRDADFYRRELCHQRYCLVWLNVRAEEAAEYIRRFLRHPEFNTWARRVGAVVGVAPAGLSVWRVRAESITHSVWPVKRKK